MDETSSLAGQILANEAAEWLADYSMNTVTSQVRRSDIILWTGIIVIGFVAWIGAIWLAAGALR